jgi:hypothetical protein
MEQEYPVPGYGEKYTVTETGKVFSYYGKGGTRRELKVNAQRKDSSRKRLYRTVSLQIPGQNKKHTLNLERVMLAAKLNRWLEPWEQVRHLDGNSENHHMNNLAPGCAVLNMLDDIEKGTRKTNAVYIEEAISRLTQLAHSHQ